MTKKEIIEVFENAKTDYVAEMNNTFIGLSIIAKYSNYVVQGANHDMIWSEDLDNLIDADITDEDIMDLTSLGFFIEDGEYLAKYV